MKIKNTQNIYIALIFIIAVIFLYPFLLSPFSISTGHDMVSYYFPYWTYIQNSFQENGSVPLWNNSIMCGTTIIGNAHFSYFYPLNWMFLFLPVPLAFNLWFLIHLLIIGYGMFYLLNYLKLGNIPALYGSIIVMFSGQFTVRMDIGHYHLVSAVAWMPLALLFLIKYIEKPGFRTLLRFTLINSIFLLTLHLQIFYYASIIFAFIFLLYTLLSGKENKHSLLGWLKQGGFLIFSYISSILICSAQLLPVIEATLNSHRSEHNYAIFSKVSLTINQIFGLFIPDLWGTSSKYIGAMNYWEISAFIGITALIPLIISIGIKDRKLRIFQIVAIIALLFTLGKYTPLGKLIYALPFMSYTRVPARFLLPLIMLLAISASFGLEQIIAGIGKSKDFALKIIIAISAIFATLTLFIFLYKLVPDFIKSTVFYSEKLSNEKTDPLIQHSILYAGIFLALLGLLFILIRFEILKFMKPKHAALIFALLLFLELFLYNRNVIKPVDVKILHEGYDSLQDYTYNEKDIYRIYGLEYRGQIGLTDRSIQQFVGYEALKNHWFFEITDNIKKTMSYKKSDHNLYYSNLLKAANVKYIFKQIRYADRIPGYKAVSRIVLRERLNRVFQSKKYLPRAYFTNKTVQGERIDDFFDFIIKDKAKSSVFIAKQVPFDDKKNVFLPAQIESYKPDKIKLKITAPTDGIVVLSDTFFPGWKAFVNGKECEIIRVNYAFRGVEIKNGENEILYVYSPKTLNIGIIISLISIATLIVLILISEISHKKKNNSLQT
ncbi:MAG: YfhO family protein [Acidobacteria bacterium]|nr:YfhO family protein [Acidobacteriota bacterium]